MTIKEKTKMWNLITDAEHETVREIHKAGNHSIILIKTGELRGLEQALRIVLDNIKTTD